MTGLDLTNNKVNNRIKFLSVLFILVSFCTNAQVHNKLWKSITQSQNEKWFASAEAIKIAENVLLYQRNIGGWPKNIQMQKVLSDKGKKILLDLKSFPDMSHYCLLCIH